jgi:hypothetical protein
MGGFMQPGRDTHHLPPSSLCTVITSPFTFKYCINIGHRGISVGTEHYPVVVICKRGPVNFLS